MGEEDGSRSERLAASLRRAWKDSGLSLQELVDRAGWFSDTAYLSRAFSGKQTLSLPALEAVAGALGVDYRQLLARAGLDEESYRSRHRGRAAPRTHEQQAEELNRTEQWAEAAVHWQVAADIAARRAEWPAWARCTIAAGQMALNLGRYAPAERRLRQILDHPSGELPPQAVAEAQIRLGWLYSDQESFPAARLMLIEGLRQTRLPVGADRQEFRVLENGSTSVCDGHGATIALEQIAQHFLGRVEIALGAPEHGLGKLDAGCEYARAKQEAWTLGCRLLEKLPGLLATDAGDRAAIERVLGECRPLMSTGRSGDGFLYLGEALWRIAAETGNAMASLEAACQGFGERMFYPRGLAEAHRLMSALHGSKSGSHQEALHYAFVACILRPYGRTLDRLAEAIGVVYSDGAFDARRVRRTWRRLEEEAWLMERPPFQALLPLIRHLGYEQGRDHIEQGLATARRIGEGVIDA